MFGGARHGLPGFLIPVLRSGGEILQESLQPLYMILTFPQELRIPAAVETTYRRL